MTSTDPIPDKTTTLIIHGTFAKDESWWRLGGGRQETFADRLESALAQRDCGGTVWQPALDAGMSYDAFDWQGGNRHRERVAGARKLRASLAALADKLGASEESPVRVNFVAHSHGGNVVLEALKRLPKSVRIGRVVLLGTPLLTKQPALRPFRLLGLAAMLGMVGLVLLMAIAQLISVASTGDFIDSRQVPGEVLLLLSIPMIALYGWTFWLLVNLGDLVWRIVSWLLRPRPLLGLLVLAILSGGVTFAVSNGPWLKWWAGAVLLGILVVSTVATFWKIRMRWDEGVYGPTPKLLMKVLQRRPAVLFTSHHDEADLLLKLGVAPREVYKEAVREHLHPVLRALEGLLVRPIAVGLLLRELEVVLERFVLGFSWTRVMFLDYEMADLDTSRAYPQNTVFQRIDVTDELRAGEKVRRASGALVAPMLEPETKPSQLRGIARQKETLSETLAEVGQYMKSQLKLRHSLYYESPEIIDRIAVTLVDQPV